MLQPEMGQHMEYAGKVESNGMNQLYYMQYLAGGKLYGYSFAKSQFYPTSKE